MLLREQVLATLPQQVIVPSYRRERLQAGQVHLGLGVFHRAHQLFYTERLLNLADYDDYRWGVIGVSLRSPKVQQQLSPQDHLYTLITRSDKPSYQIISALLASVVAPLAPLEVLQHLTAASTKIVSLTISEKGYCYQPATGKLQVDHPQIIHDLERPEQPQTALGLLAASLKQRFAAGIAPFTVLSCDNLPQNGRLLRRLLLEFVAVNDSVFADWIRANVSFPATMVDRITPATTAADIELLQHEFGFKDQHPVVTEPFSQWVIEDDFTAGRPQWERVGVTFCSDVEPFERMKLALLNGTHSTMAYAGYLSGFDTVADCIADAELGQIIRAMMAEEIAPTLQLPAGVDIDRYQQQLIERYRNPAIQHLTKQIAMDGSQKLPPRLLVTIEKRIAAGRNYRRLSFAVACWCHFLGRRRDNGDSYDIDDPLAASLEQRLAAAGADNRSRLLALLAESRIFNESLAANKDFQQQLLFWYSLMRNSGARAAITAAAKL